MNSKIKALILTARPKTLAAAVVPVVVATALVCADGQSVSAALSVCAVLSAIFIQIGTNFVNDSIDFKKGADKETRLGEARASQSGWFEASTVLWLGLLSFFIAMLLGLPLVIVGGYPILLIGLFSLLMGYAYTGGPFPLAYVGLGDLFVIIFFGVVAVGGVYWLQTATYSWSALVAGLQVGLLATVLIAINNLRDIDQDRLVNKKTFAVRLGPKWGPWEVAVLNALAFLLNVFWLLKGQIWAAVLPFLLFPLAWKLSQSVLRTKPSQEYNQFLARAAKVHMLFGILLSLGFILP
jgi:1,4-dihydroxy-2-naphthoate octaprenyltransferase